MCEKKFMTRRQILDTIKDLGRTKGFYSKLYSRLISLRITDHEYFNQFMNHLVNQQFADPVDVVLYFEC